MGGRLLLVVTLGGSEKFHGQRRLRRLRGSVLLSTSWAQERWEAILKASLEGR